MPGMPPPCVNRDMWHILVEWPREQGQPQHSRQHPLLPQIVDAETRAQPRHPGGVRARAVAARADGSARRYGVRLARTE